jgi:hypothetical protein
MEEPGKHCATLQLVQMFIPEFFIIGNTKDVAAADELI